MEQPSFFSRYGDVAIFGAGALMTAAGVLLVDATATQVVLLLLGTGLMVMGAVLPRLSGTIRISPGSLEMTVIQQLEATRRQAEESLPDRVEEAVGLAFERLMESGALAPRRPDGGPSAPVPRPAAAEEPWGAPPAAAAAAPPPPFADAAEAPRRAPPIRLAAGAAAVVVLVVTAGALLVLADNDAPITPTPTPPTGVTATPDAGNGEPIVTPTPAGGPATPTATARPTTVPTATPSPAPILGAGGPLWAVVLALGAIVLASAVFALARRRPLSARTEQESSVEPPDVFARRIVEELSTRRSRDR